MKTDTIKLLLILGCLFSGSFALSQPPAYVPQNGLVGWWPFNGNVLDESGNGNNGSIVGSPTLSLDRFANPNSSYSMNSCNDFIKINDTSSLVFSSHTVSLWFAGNNSGGCFLGDDRNSLISKGNPDNDSALYLFLKTGNLFCGNSYVSPLLVPNPSFWWDHIVMVYDSSDSTGSIYWNDSLALFTDSLFLRIDNNSDLLFSMADYGSGSLDSVGMYGQIDDIGIWNRALTRQEIRNLFNSTSTDLIRNDNYLSLLIYPNPANESFTLDFGLSYSSLIGGIINITNSTGKLVYSSSIEKEKQIISRTTLNGSGVYFISVVNSQGLEISRNKLVLQ